MIEKTTTVYLSGTCNWAKVYKPDEKFKRYEMDFFPDDESLEKIREIGPALEERDTDGQKWYRVSRPVEKLIKDELVKFGPPTVVLATGDLDDKGIPITEPTKKLIGNGSNVTIKVQFYPSGRYIGHRLEAVRVDKLIEYAPDNKPREPSEEYPF